jgi:predicted transcriptional regulator
MLAGQKRIQLLRRLYKDAGQSVTQLGEAVGIKRSDASQELRRIQSRGLLSSKRQGVRLIYSMKPDPQVPSAAPVLHAIQSALKAYPPERDLEMCRIASNLANERRIRIVRELLDAPLTRKQIQMRIEIPEVSLAKHLRVLEHNGFIRQTEDPIRLAVPRHPLAKTLIKLVQAHRSSAST